MTELSIEQRVELYTSSLSERKQGAVKEVVLVKLGDSKQVTQESECIMGR